MPDRMPRAAGEAKPRRSRLLWVGLPVFTVFAAFGIIVWLAYQDNARVPEGEPPLVRAIAGPYKVAPDDPGGRQVADQGEINALLRDEPGPALPERVLPLPEAPRAPMVRAAPPEPSPAEAEETPATVAAPEPSTPADQAPPAQARAPERADAPQADATQEAEAALSRLLSGVEPQPSAEQPAASAPAPVAVPAVRPESPPATASTAVRRDAPRVGTPSREADQALDRLLAEVAGVPADTTPEPRAVPPSPPPGAVAAIAPADPGSRGFRVQLAAVRDQDDARRAWSGLAERLGSLVADYQPHYERAETANGVFYRVQLGPFASAQSADRLCAEVKRRNASCFVVAP